MKDRLIEIIFQEQINYRTSDKEHIILLIGNFKNGQTGVPKRRVDRHGYRNTTNTAQ